MATIWSCGFSPVSDHIVSGSSDGTVRQWGWRTRQQTSLFSGHTSWVTAVRYNGSGTRICSASRDCSVRLWDASHGGGAQLLELWGHSSWTTCCALMHEGAMAVSGSHVCTPRVLRPTPPSPASRPLPPGLVHARRFRFVLPDVPRLRRRGRGCVDSAPCWSVELTPTLCTPPSPLPPQDKTVRLWDLTGGVEAGCLRGVGGMGHTAGVYGVAASRDGGPSPSSQSTHSQSTHAPAQHHARELACPPLPRAHPTTTHFFFQGEGRLREGVGSESEVGSE